MDGRRVRHLEMDRLKKGLTPSDSVAIHSIEKLPQCKSRPTTWIGTGLPALTRRCRSSRASGPLSLEAMGRVQSPFIGTRLFVP